MSLLDTLISHVAPYECLLCGSEGTLVCADCTPHIGTPSSSRCFKCMKPTVDFQICDNCYPTIPLEHVWSAYPYEKTAKRMVKEFKFEGKRAAAHTLATLTARAVPRLKPDVLVVHIPTATAHVRERGYDQALLLARAFAKERQLLHATLLSRTKQLTQHGAGRQDRLRNIQGAYTLCNPELIPGAHILLVDDVVTTGATLAEAARVLLQAGAKSVSAAVFAQTIL